MGVGIWWEGERWVDFVGTPIFLYFLRFLSPSPWYRGVWHLPLTLPSLGHHDYHHHGHHCDHWHHDRHSLSTWVPGIWCCMIVCCFKLRKTLGWLPLTICGIQSPYHGHRHLCLISWHASCSLAPAILAFLLAGSCLRAFALTFPAV